jgi:hypothetical protein
MEFIFDCPHCQRQLAAEAGARGQTVACPACQQPLIVPSPPPAAAEAGPEEVVEVVEEFKLPPIAPPPLAPRPPAGPVQPFVPMPGLAPRAGLGGPLEAEPFRLSRRPERARLPRHTYAPLHRRARAVVVSVVVVFCGLLAAVIYLIGRPPGATPAIASTTQRSEPAATNTPLQVEIARLSGAEQQELVELTLQAFRNLSPDEGQAASLIFGRLSQQQPTTEEQMALFNKLFQKGVLQMPPENRQRLQHLFAKAVPPPPQP